jgi:hypothetical protein
MAKADGGSIPSGPLLSMLADGRGIIDKDLAAELAHYQNMAKGQISQIIVGDQLSDVPGRPVLSPVFQGMGAVGKGLGLGASGITFQLLRNIRERSIVLQAIHSARAAQMRAFSLRSYGTPGEIGWRVVHRDWRNPRARVPDSIQRHIERASRKLMSPSRMHGNFTMGDVLAQLWDDLATINRPALEVLRASDGTWSGLRPIDGAKVWDSAAWLSLWASGAGRQHLKPTMSNREMLEVASSHMNVDLTNLARARYLYVENNVVLKALDAENLVVGSARTRTDVAYGPYTPGYVENCLEVAIAVANAWEYNGNFFTTGMTSDVLLLLRDGMGSKVFNQFARALRENTQGVSKAHQPAVAEVPNPTQDVHALNVSGRTNKEMQFEIWTAMLFALACAIYRMDPSTINCKPWDGGSGPSLNAPTREREISLAKEEGLRTDLRHLVAAMLTPVVQEEHADLEVHLDDGTFDPGRALELNSKAVATTDTPNEIRVREGKRPLGFFIHDDEWEKASDADKAKHEANVYNHIANSTMNMRAQFMAMQAGQGGGGADPNDPNAGGPGGPGGPDGDMGGMAPDDEGDDGQDGAPDDDQPPRDELDDVDPRDPRAYALAFERMLERQRDEQDDDEGDEPQPDDDDQPEERGGRQGRAARPAQGNGRGRR